MLNAILEALTVWGLCAAIIIIPTVILLYVGSRIVLDVIFRLRDDRDDRLQDDYHE